ncbi:MAG: type II toxin-antitoxin system VapC family toxin [Cyanobacteria bacterium J06648_1]
MIIADTNLIAYLLIEGEFTQQAERVYEADRDWLAPYLWRSEFRNILALYLRKNYLSLSDAKMIVFQAEDLMRGNEYEIDSESLLNLSSQCSLSAYECEYIVLAQKLGVNLVTGDKKILQSFPNLAIALKDYA